MNLAKLNELVRETKLSKTQLATRCGITRVTLDNALQGGDIRVSILERLAHALNINVGELFDNFADEDATGAVASGDHSAAAVNGNATVMGADGAAVLEERIRSLEEQARQKDLLLAEKERLIRVLLNGRE